jgi:hypothetical protein
MIENDWVGTYNTEPIDTLEVSSSSYEKNG